MLAAQRLKYRYAVTKVPHVLWERQDDAGFVRYFRVSGRAEADPCPDRAKLPPPFPPRILAGWVKSGRIKDPGFLSPGFPPVI